MADVRTKSLAWGTAAAAIGGALVLANLDATVARVVGTHGELLQRRAPAPSASGGGLRVGVPTKSGGDASR